MKNNLLRSRWLLLAMSAFLMMFSPLKAVPWLLSDGNFELKTSTTMSSWQKFDSQQANAWDTFKVFDYLFESNFSFFAPQTITQSNSQEIIPYNTVACSNFFGDTLENKYYRVFDLSADHGISGDFEITHVEFGVEETSGDLEVTLNIYSLAGNFPADFANATLQGSATYTPTPNDDFEVVNVPLSATIPANQKLIYEIITEDGSSIFGYLYMGSNNLGESHPSYLQSDACLVFDIQTIEDATDFDDVHMVMNVIGEEVEDHIDPCAAVVPPYSLDFEDSSEYECIALWKNGSGNHWGLLQLNAEMHGFGPGIVAGYQYSTYFDANAWLITKAISLEVGKEYKISYKYGSAGYEESMKVAYGLTQDIPGMSNVLADHPSITNSPLTNEVTFSVAASGDYFFGFNAYSSADQFRLYLDDIHIEEVEADPNQPTDYCIPEGVTSGRYINNFSTTDGIQNISNMGTGFSTGGYGDYFNTHTVQQVQGEEVSFTADIVGGTAGFRVWVDWDQDGVFDADEEVAWNSEEYGNTQVGSFKVPTTALVGETRMRIVSHWLSKTGAVDPCATGFSYGEFEDYKFIVEELDLGSGETCEDAMMVTSLPFDHAGNTGDYGNDYSREDVPPLAPGAITDGSTAYAYYLGGADVVYTYTPTEDEVLNITTTNDTWVGLFAFTGCPFASTVGYHTATTAGTRAIMGLPVTAGETYYFVISTWSAPETTDYTIHIEKVDEGGMTEEDCSQATLSNNLENGYGQMHLLILANDFVVEEGADFSLEKITANFFIEASRTIQSATINFYEDSGNGPGAAIGSPITALVPTSQEIIGNGFGMDVREAVFELPTAVDFASSASGQTVYWVGMQIAYNGSNSYMEVSTNYNTPNMAYLSVDGVEWISVLDQFDDMAHGVIKLEGTCEGDGNEPPTEGDCSVEFAHSNADGSGNTSTLMYADDFMISAGTSMSIDTVTLTLINNIGVASTLAIHEDAGGQPAATALHTFSNLAPDSQTVVDFNFGFNFYDVRFSLPTTVDLDEGTYWIVFKTTAGSDGGTNYWAITTSGIGSPGKYSNNSGASWTINQSSYNYAFKLEGTCEGEGNEPPVSGDCEQGLPSASTAVNSYGITSDDVYRVADDFVVAEGVTFTMDRITIDMNQELVPNSVEILIHANNNGQPGTVLHTLTPSVSSSTVVGSAFGDPIYHLVFDLDTPIEFTEGTYWLNPNMTTSDNETNWWAASQTVLGSVAQVSSSLGATWVNDPNGYNMVFTVSGTCEGEGGTDPNPEYCEPELDCTDGDVILNVTFEEINNTTTCSPDGYGDYTSMVANVESGNSYPISVKVGNGWAFESVSVWIDFNNNGIFEQNEFYYIGTGSNQVLTGTIAIPADVSDGNYRMRVRVAAVGESSATWDMACDETHGFGETEDYTIAVGEVTGGDGCDWVVTVSDSNFGDEVHWELRDASNAILLSGGGYGLGYNDVQTVTAEGPLTFFITSDGFFGDNTPAYSVANENGVILSGVLPGGTTSTFTDLNCDDLPPPPPAYTCDEQFVAANTLENGSFFGGETNQRLAFDIITGEAGFSIYGLELNVFVDGSTDIDFFITLYSDEGGVPGSIIQSGFGSIHSNDYVGSNFGFDAYKYVVEFESAMTLSANTTYWMEVESDAVAWQNTKFSTFGSNLAFLSNTTSGDWWISDSGELVYKLVCQELGLSELSAFDFTYYPNPVRDVLNITSRVDVQSVEVFNLAGQKVLSTRVSHGQVDVATLSAGTYVFRATLENGQVETFKIIKR